VRAVVGAIGRGIEGVDEDDDFAWTQVAWRGTDILDRAAGGYKQAVVAESFDEVPNGAEVDSQQEAEIFMGEKGHLFISLSAEAKQTRRSGLDGTFLS
jgi:hypothetical protein